MIRDDIDVSYALLLMVGVFIGSISQIMLKKAANKKYKNFISAYLNRFVVIAYIIFGGTTVISMYAYKGITLSLGFVIETMGYVFVTIWGVLIFKEQISKKKIFALGLIIFGTIIYSFCS